MFSAIWAEREDERRANPLSGWRLCAWQAMKRIGGIDSACVVYLERLAFQMPEHKTRPPSRQDLLTSESVVTYTWKLYQSLCFGGKPFEPIKMHRYQWVITSTPGLLKVICTKRYLRIDFWCVIMALFCSEMPHRDDLAHFGGHPGKPEVLLSWKVKCNAVH